MKPFYIKAERVERAEPAEGWRGVYLASDVAKLEQRLIACEAALLMAAAGSTPDAYMARYPEPYSAS
jgi:hypothetical protein